MAFRGTPNTKGRTPGAAGVVTQEVKKAFSKLIENNLDQLQNDLDQLEPLHRIKIIIQLSEFIIPKMKSIEVAAEIESVSNVQPLIIHFANGISN